ncbi:MAG: DegT/DnrJ/EryC1/StrS family aminotransferase [Actinobacteria bacterium]|nr:DegT/DnrJ/EryC1/StrS family aminotransferase [Actinomycetota bacterium]
MIPITTVRIGPEEEALVLEVLRSGQLAQGAYVERLERDFAAIHGVRHAVAVNNGTTALVAALQVLGVQPGDEVITSPFTFVATLNAILEAGATARFADIGPDFNIDPTQMAALVNERTKVLMPVHLYGCMADMHPIMDLATTHGLHVVEDAAQAVAASYHGRAAGSFGLGCFSLYATKNINTGEGGVITTDDDDLADRLRVLRNQGMRQRYQYEIAGHNYRLTNLAAAVGIPQLARVDDINRARERNAGRLREGLSDIPGLVVPMEPESGRTHVYHQFTVRITDEAAVARDAVVERLTALGIGCGIYYPKVVFDYDCYRQHPGVIADEVPAAFSTASQVLSLPVHPYLTDDELSAIVAGVRKALTK